MKTFYFYFISIFLPDFFFFFFFYRLRHRGEQSTQLKESNVDVSELVHSSKICSPRLCGCGLDSTTLLILPQPLYSLSLSLSLELKCLCLDCSSDHVLIIWCWIRWCCSRRAFFLFLLRWSAARVLFSEYWWFCWALELNEVGAFWFHFCSSRASTYDSFIEVILCRFLTAVINSFLLCWFSTAVCSWWKILHLGFKTS